MYSIKANRKSFIAVIIFVAALFVSTLFAGVKFGERAAAEEGNIGTTFYYKELKTSPLAQKFYGVISEMAENGSFDNGIYEYDLSSVLSQNEIAGYVDGGSPKIPVAFGAARDAFYMDHPDLFYIDVYKLYLSAGMKDGKYVAYVGTGNADNYYADYTVKSATEVATAKAKYETEISKAVAAAKLNNADVVTQIKNVNKYIMNKTEYDYGAYDDAMSGNVIYNGYVNTAYGALVEGKAMCGGFSRAFKAVMDRLDIPCVLIQGSVFSGADVVAEGTQETLRAGFKAHMWNAVEVDGMWYGVDVTLNEGANNPDKYMLVGDELLSQNHITDGVISSSGFELKYPAVRPTDYGVDTDRSGFTFKDSGKIGNKSFGYSSMSDESDNYWLDLGVSYNGKNSHQLAEENKYFAFRMGESEVWIGFEAYVEYMSANVDMSNVNVNEYTTFGLNWSVSKIQCAVFDYAPDMAIEDDFGATPVIGYKAENLTPDHIIAVSAVYGNKAYGGYMPAPYVKKMTPDLKGHISSFEPMQVTIEYSEKLVYADEYDKTVEVTITGRNADLGEKAKTENVVWNEKTNTLSFMLIPSKYYAHFSDMYNMVPTNLVGEKSRKVPEPANLTFKMKQVICPKVFNDGRLYMQVFGRPSFVSASDESLNGFKDDNGKPIVGNQTSQLMLVVNEPTKAESEEMKDAALDPANGTGLTSANDIKASSTYEIDLLMCGCVQKVPDGSYMQVGFGFPEGYGPESAGVTFTVYHYTRNPDGTIKDVQAVPCVVSEYGIIATVKSFSPFMICAIDASKGPQSKAVYASVNGVGGKIDNGEIQQLNSGDEVVYTITHDEGYKVDKVLLNGVAQQLVGDKLTVGYDMLDGKYNSNVLEVTFVAERVATYRAANGLEIKQPKIVVKQSDMIQAVAPSVNRSAPPSDSNVVGIVVGVVVAIFVVLIGGCLALYFVMRNKKKTATANGAPAKANADKTARAQTAEKKPVAAPQKPDVNKSAAQAVRPAAQARPTQPASRPQPQNTRPAQTATRPNVAQNRPASQQSRPVTQQSRPATQQNRPAVQNRPVAQNRPTSTGNGAQPRTPVSRNVPQNGRPESRNGANKPTNDRK